jgi:hypothetical protein
MDYLLSEKLEKKYKKFYRLSKADLRVIPGGKLNREKKTKKILTMVILYFRLLFFCISSIFYFRIVY